MAHCLRFIVMVGMLVAMGRAQAQTQPPPDTLAPILKVLPDGKTLKVIKCYPEGLMRAYCISFDDGTLGSDWPALDALRKRGIPATFFINSLHLQSKDAVAFPERYAGFEIASHGANHKGLGKMELSQARQEIEQDQQILGEKFKYKVEGFAYPYGDFPKDSAALEALEKTMAEMGIRYARCTGETKAFVPPENFLHWVPDCGFIGNVDKLLALPADDSVRVMMAFAHSIDFARGRMPFEKWEKDLDQVAADKTIWKQTMIGFVHYIDALRALGVSEAGIENKSDISVWISVNGRAIEIPAGKTWAWKDAP